MLQQRHQRRTMSFLRLLFLTVVYCSVVRTTLAQETTTSAIQDRDDPTTITTTALTGTPILYEDDDNDIPEECQNYTSTTFTADHRYSSMTCWFYFLRIQIPDQSFHSHMVSVQIKDLSCSNFSLKVLESHYQPAVVTEHDETPAALAIGLANLSATCHGKYHATGGFSGSILAVLGTAAPSDNDDGDDDDNDDSSSNNDDDDDDPTLHDPIRLLWSLSGDTNNTLQVLEPSTITTTSCVANGLEIAKLRFSGSMSAHMVDWFRHNIQSYVKEKVAQEFCPALRETVDPLLNGYLQEMRDYLNQHLKWPFIMGMEEEMYNDHDAMTVTERDATVLERNNERTTAQETVANKDDDNVVRWYTEAPLLSSSMLLWNRFVNTHLNQGFLPNWLPSLNHREEKTCGFFFHGINGIIHALLDLEADDNDNHHHGDGPVWYSLPLPQRVHNISFVVPGYAAVALDLYEIAIAGLDHWDHLQVFQPTRDDLFFSRIQTNQPISFQLQAQLNITSIPDGMIDHELNEDFTISFDFAQMEWNSTLALWVDRTMWRNNVTMGVLLDVVQALFPGESGQIPKDALHCLLGSIQGFEAPELSLNTTLSSMKVFPTGSSSPSALLPTLLSQSLEEDLDDLFNNALKLLITGFPEYISSAIAGLVDGPMRESLEGFLQRITNSSQSSDDDDDDDDDDSNNNNETLFDGSTCPVPNETSEPHLLNFTKVLPIETLQNFMKHPKTIHRMNSYIQCTADYIAGAVKGDSWSLLDLLGMEANDFADEQNDQESSWNESSFQLRLDEFSFLNLGQIDSLTLLDPEDDGLSLTTSLVYGSSDNNDWDDQPHVSVQLSLSLPNAVSQTNISVVWSDLELASSSILHYDVNQLKSYGLADVFQHGHCLLTPISDFETMLAGDSDEHMLGLFAVIVNTSVILDNDGEERELSYSLSTLDYPTVANLTEAIITWIATSARDIVNLGSVYSLSQASKLCVAGSSGNPGGSTPADDDDDVSDDYDSETTWSLLLILASIFVLAQPVVLLFRSTSEIGDDVEERQNGSQQQQQDINNSSQLTQPLLDPGAEHEQLLAVGRESGAESDTKEPALVDCPHLPIFVRVFLPTLIMVTIAILVSSNVSVGASVELTAQIGQKTFNLPSLFEFSLVNTAAEMWNAGIYPVFFLVVVFSGIWPYAKLVIMLFCVSSNRVHDAQRGQILLALDSLGKFSLVDTYVLVLMMVAFRYDLKFFDSQAVSLDVLVEPQYGFYGFLLATTTSLIAGHMAVYYHRQAEISIPSGSLSDLKCPPQSLLRGHSYQITNERRKISQVAQLTIMCFLLSATVLLGVGMTRKSFVFEFGGLAGLALGDARSTEYSLVSLGTAILGSSSGTIGPSILMVTYFFYAVVAPFSCLFLLFLLLVVPMNVRRQLTLLSMAEVANAWSAVEVFCLSIVAALLEISSFASFIMGDKCDAVNEVIAHYWPDDQDLADANCYTVRSSVKWDSAILILGAIMNSFVVSIALRLIHTAMNDRVQQEGWVSLGSDNGPARPDNGWSFVERIFSWLFEHGDSTGAELDSNGASPTDFPPQSPSRPEESNGGEEKEETGDSPWRQGNGFSSEWEKDAERDPNWKAWKDQEGNGSTQQISEMVEPTVESPGRVGGD